jgi:hypothetical protein
LFSVVVFPAAILVHIWVFCGGGGSFFFLAVSVFTVNSGVGLPAGGFGDGLVVIGALAFRCCTLQVQVVFCWLPVLDEFLLRQIHRSGTFFSC